MEKQISFLGVNLTPYSDISPDGQLALCVGLERHAGSLRPLALHGTDYLLPAEHADVRLMAVHDTAVFRHFIFRSTADDALYWADRPDEGGQLALTSFGSSLAGLSSVSTLGNTLVMVADDGMHFYLWQEDTYAYLGTQMPHLPITFGLRGGVVRRTTEIEIKGDYSAVADTSQPVGSIYGLTEEDHAAVNASLPGFVNGLLDDEKGYNRFVWPFFARWGYETAFGDMLFSPPVLLIPNSGGTVNVESEKLEKRTDSRFYVSFFSTAPNYHLPDAETWKAELEKWKDIITGISFYVSDPISAYVSDGQYSQVWNDQTTAAAGTRRTAGFGILSDGDNRGPWQQTSEEMFYHIHLQTPVVTDEEYLEKFRTVSTFWKVATVKPSALEADALVPMEVNTLANLGTQPHIETEALNEHDALIPRYSFVYNQRLHIANVTRRLHAFPAETLATRWTGWQNEPAYRYTFYVYCNDSGGSQVVKCAGEELTQATTFYWLYYPNPSAYKIVIEQTTEADGTKKYAEVELKEHPLMHGAYWFGDFQDLTFEADASYTPPAEQPLVDNPNKLYTSEVGTPFYFPTSGINTVGVGDIVGLASITTALSQGQFGQFPLMVFCTDGNYAMQTGTDGLFAGVSPMQRDVCTNPASITQIDGAIVYVSARGVMSADGSRIDCLSAVLDGVAEDLSWLSPDGSSSTAVKGRPALAPADFFQTCIPAYDYAGRRILFLSPDDEAAYVLSLEDASWSQAWLGAAASVVNVYPYSYVQFADTGSICRLDEGYPYDGGTGTSFSGMVLTRPLKLDSLQLKRIRQLALEGCFTRSQQLRLYGSNDGTRWHPLGSSMARRVLMRGSYFKYYRLAIVTSLDETENLSGLRLDYDIRPERRLR